MPIDLHGTARAFAVPGRMLGAELFGSGHINDTYRATFERAGVAEQYVLQRINTDVFPDPEALMENAVRVTGHLRLKLEAAGMDEVDRRVLTFIPTRNDAWIHEDVDGQVWRMCRYVERSRAYETAAEPWQAEAAGRAFGRFHRQLADLPGPPLHEVIPGFHDARKRFDALQRAAASDACGRFASVRAEIDFVRRRESMVDVVNTLLAAGDVPVRTVHNDAKLNNLLFDADTSEALCVVDLDTVMPGSALYDVGDLIRTVASTSREDDRDASQMTLSRTRFEALLRGYLGEMGETMTDAERAHLVFSGIIITFIMGMRFLTDYLEGDVYYKTARPVHNLDRCRTQFRLVEAIEAEETALEHLVRSC